MLRVASVLACSLCLSACSVGYLTMPFAQTAAARPVSPDAELAAARREPPLTSPGKTALGGPAQAQPSGATTSPAPFGDPGALDLINELRFAKGLPPLAADPALTRAAQMQASYLARTGTLTHIGPGGSTPIDRVRMTGFQPAVTAENIAGGQENVIEAIRSWRESEAHLRNMLLADATRMGIAQLADPKSGARTYWVLVLAAPRTS